MIFVRVSKEEGEMLTFVLIGTSVNFSGIKVLMPSISECGELLYVSGRGMIIKALWSFGLAWSTLCRP